ncbi:hypothetical protein GQ44DRAFT_776360 [Phaeosphaeriaceae sp. PMI808]|nr:hypothetical protein GQ44DRAFT_776360 [Phaeosphaeriaceae sp. PMI808]
MHFQSTITILIGLFAISTSAVALNAPSSDRILVRRQEAANGTPCDNRRGDCQNGVCISRGADTSGLPLQFNSECADQAKEAQRKQDNADRQEALGLLDGNECEGGDGICQGGKCIDQGADFGQPFIFNGECENPDLKAERQQDQKERLDELNATNGKKCEGGDGICQTGKCIDQGADFGQPFVFNDEC